MRKVHLLSSLLITAMFLALLAGCACQHEWVEANCSAPKTCKLCNETEGEKNDSHNWEDATTEAPKTCSLCGKTDGEKINVDSRFKTANCKEVFGTWSGRCEIGAEQMGLTGDLVIPMTLTMIFSNDGQLEMTSELEDADAFRQTFINYLVELMYQQFSASGMNKSQADAACKAQYGMDVTEYCTQIAQESVKNMSSSVKMVYYAESGKIYAANNWNEEMEPENYEIKNGKLFLDDNDLKQTIEFTKVAE